jgi:sulfite exporter TauE/SafE
MNGNRIVGGLLVGLGTAMSVLGVMDSRYLAQRVLYVVAGLMFIVAGVYRLGRREPEQR